jgi:hypothetical protein
VRLNTLGLAKFLLKSRLPTGINLNIQTMPTYTTEKEGVSIQLPSRTSFQLSTLKEDMQEGLPLSEEHHPMEVTTTMDNRRHRPVLMAPHTTT